MSERRGTKGLELWCRRMTEGYAGVNVVNMTTSWRDGLAFCAIIHHFRPDLIEFSKLNKDNIYYNNELAFNIAERHLGIPALLEPEDMVEFAVPDRLSILTYLSQYYQTFVVSQGKSSSRITTKRPAATSPDRSSLVSTTSSSPPTKTALSSPSKLRREPCTKCNLPVFIAERLIIGKLLYHRTCFRCARCNSQLTLANYYETENNEFCCETCPDEEKDSSSSVLTRSLSDEEKSASLKTQNQPETDEYSTTFETALEYPINSTVSSVYTKARSAFIGSQVSDVINHSDDDSGNEEPPDLPKTKPPQLVREVTLKDSLSDSGFPKDKLQNNVNIENSVSLKDTSSSRLEKSHDFVVTKDAISAKGSLVKARMRLFETKSDVNDDKVPLKIDMEENASNNILNNEISPITETQVKEEEEEEEVTNNDSIENLNDTIITISDTSISDKRPVVSIETSFCDNRQQEDSITDESCIIISDTSQEIPKIDESIDVSVENSEEQTTIKTQDKEAGDVINENNIIDCKIDSPPEMNEEYPDDLNPFGDVEENPQNVSLNPFDDDDDEIVEKQTPKPAERKKIQPISEDREMSRIYIERISVNPFEEATAVPQPAVRKVIQPPRISFGNPFWSDDEEEEDKNKPTPKPRSIKSTPSVPEAKPRESLYSSSIYGSSSSLTSTHSVPRKKKLAPKPPIESGHSSLTSSPCHSVTQSPKLTPKVRKAKKAPLPPTSTPLAGSSVPLHLDLTTNDDYDTEKFTKDEENRTKQHLNQLSPSDNVPNKSTYGKWKRRKGQAPSKPIPQKRVIRQLPMNEVKRELEVIEIQQQGLERQGVRLEQIIRERCEGPNVNPDEYLSTEVEDMVLQLFELVNEKNELFRRQTELMYIRRQYKLEEEHADIEYQIRCLMLQPEANKTDSDKAKEEELINRLVEIVERRNEIIEGLEMDRVRETEEDDSISNHLNLFAAKKEEIGQVSVEIENKKDKKKHKKFKFKMHKVDVDKDIDESETSKEKKKKKFNLF